MYGRIPYLNIDWNSWAIYCSFLSSPLLLMLSVIRGCLWVIPLQLPFLISVVTFLIYSHLTSDMYKSFKTCSLFAIGILIRVKIGLEFSVLFSLSRYIFCLFFHFSCIYYFYLYIYICCDGFLFYITCEFPISISHVIFLITSKYSIILQKIHLSLIILFSIVGGRKSQAE